MARLACAAFGLLLTSCASTGGPSLGPLPAGRDVEMCYEADLGPAARPTELAAREAAESEPLAVEAAPADPIVLVHCALRELDSRDLARLLGSEPPSNVARVAKRDELERALAPWLESGAMREGPKHWIELHDRKSGYVSVYDGTAFVEGFGIVRSGTTLIGDPRVALTREGRRFDVRAELRRAAATIDVDVGLTVNALVRPLFERELRLPGTTHDVEIEVPLYFSQVLKATATLATDEVLVLGPLVAADSKRRIVAFIEAREEPRGGSDASRKIASLR